MEPHLPARDIRIRLAEIRLAVAGPMAQRHEHLAAPQRRRCHILPHDRVAAGIAFLSPQPLKNPPRRFTVAQPVNHHSTSHSRMEFHCKHPSSPPCQQ
jgi:hypothetical protein